MQRYLHRKQCCRPTSKRPASVVVNSGLPLSRTSATAGSSASACTVAQEPMPLPAQSSACSPLNAEPAWACIHSVCKRAPNDAVDMSRCRMCVCALVEMTAQVRAAIACL